jgi:DNA-binding NarL/FixJ family response regulator
VDRLEVDPFETIRRIRFVLPDAVVAVFTKVRKRKWLVACHLAGANCMLCQSSTSDELALGLRTAVDFGCYTDTRFARA